MFHLPSDRSSHTLRVRLGRRFALAAVCLGGLTLAAACSGDDPANSIVELTPTVHDQSPLAELESTGSDAVRAGPTATGSRLADIRSRRAARDAALAARFRGTTARTPTHLTPRQTHPRATMTAVWQPLTGGGQAQNGGGGSVAYGGGVWEPRWASIPPRTQTAVPSRW